MKIRIKFAKQGNMKYIGHLDIMRYFQKAIRRSDIDIRYSEGFSPHQKMSFASPLGVGLLSRGEYFDIEVESTKTSKESEDALNATMVEGMKIISYRLLPDDAKNCMAIIAAADYLVHFKDENFVIDNDIIDAFISRESIDILKKTKKSEKTMDIKPLIFEMKNTDEGLFMKVSAGSVDNLKPEVVMEALCQFAGIETIDAVYERLEIYARDSKNGLVSLESIGEIIE